MVWSVKWFGCRLDRHFVDPDLGPNCFQRFSEDAVVQHIGVIGFASLGLLYVQSFLKFLQDISSLVEAL